MTLKERLIKMLLPEGAIVLTKEEIAALNAYQEKLNGGGDALEKE